MYMYNYTYSVHNWYSTTLDPHLRYAQKSQSWGEFLWHSHKGPPHDHSSHSAEWPLGLWGLPCGHTRCGHGLSSTPEAETSWLIWTSQDCVLQSLGSGCASVQRGRTVWLPERGQIAQHWRSPSKSKLLELMVWLKLSNLILSKAMLYLQNVPCRQWQS